MRKLTFVLLTCPLLLTSSPASADDVHLVNGRSFEGVVAEVEGSEVLIRLPQGEIRIPKSRVARVEKIASPFEEYLRAKKALEASGATRATDWVELARIARSRGLEGAAREAALTAAELDPQAEGLEALLTRMGFRLDEDAGEWIPHSIYMGRRGFVFSGGEWIPREEYQARQAARRQEIEDARRERLAEQQARLALEVAIEARVQAEVAKEVARTPALGPVAAGPSPVILGGTFPVFFFTPGTPGQPHGPRSPEDVDGSPFTQTLRESILSRDFGGGLGASVSSRSRPTGYEGAPGRLKTRFP